MADWDHIVEQTSGQEEQDYTSENTCNESRMVVNGSRDSCGKSGHGRTSLIVGFCCDGAAPLLAQEMGAPDTAVNAVNRTCHSRIG